MDDAVRDRPVENFVGQLLNSVRKRVRQRGFEYRRNVDKDLGDRFEKRSGARQHRLGVCRLAGVIASRLSRRRRECCERICERNGA
jgi:catalase